MMSERFKKANNIGKKGEMVVWYKLTHAKGVRAVMDVSNDTDFRMEDVDFLIQKDGDEQVYRIEVKTDEQAHSTGNIYYEKEDRGHTGCFAKTTAHYMFIYISHTDELLFVDMPKLRKHVETTDYVLKTGGEQSKGYLIPIQTLIDEKIAKYWR